MHIYVCIKHVPDTAAQITIIDQRNIDESVEFVTNPYDEYAIEEALTFREKSSASEVVVVSVGKDEAQKSLRRALAMGCDRGILVKTDERFIDSIQVAHALHKVISQDGSPLIIFTGKQSTDQEGMQTPFRLAALFDMPIGTSATAFSKYDNSVSIEHETEGGAKEIVTMPLPCVITATKGLNIPRYPKLPDIMKAKRKEINVQEIVSLGIDIAGAGMELDQLRQSNKKRTHKILRNMDSDEMVNQLVNQLLHEDKII